MGLLKYPRPAIDLEPNDGPTPSTIPGTYNLTTVDGAALPFTALDLGAYRAKLVSGTLSLSSDGSYTVQLGIRIEDSGNVRTSADTDGGLWNVNAITLASTEGNNSRKARFPET